MKRVIKKTKRHIKFSLIRLLNIKDSANHVSLGFAVGFIMNFIPTFGLGIVISAIATKLIKGNVAANLIGSFSTMWMFPLFLYLNAINGVLILELIEKSFEFIEIYKQVDLLNEFNFIETFLIGMLVNVVFFGISSYLLLQVLLRKYRKQMLKWVVEKFKAG